MEHNCKFEDKVIEMYADIKFLVKETKRINGSFTKHLEESTKFRAQVERNTAWRWAYKFIIVGICSILAKLVFF